MEVLSLSLPFFGLILLGWASAKATSYGEDGLKWMSFFIIYIALPALFFQLIRKTPLEELANPGFILGTSGSTLAIFLLAYLFGRYFSRNTNTESTMQAVAGSYSNIGYMGPGLTLAAFGEAAVVPTALVFCFDNALLFTLTPLFVELGKQSEHHIGSVLLQAVKKVLLHPFIMATIAGILASAIHFEPPLFIENILNLLKGAAAPCALFVLGVVIAGRKAHLNSIDIPVTLLIKLLLHPLLVYLLLSWIGNIPPIWLYTGVLMSALPPALNVFILAQQYDAFIEQASSIVLIGTIIAVFTVTALLYAIRYGWI
jgi:malonate transporter